MDILHSISEIRKMLEIECYENRKEELEKIRARLIEEISKLKNNVEYIMLLLTLELELRKENEYISSEQRMYYNKYSQYWTDKEKTLWKINYAGFIFDEERNDDGALSILETVDLKYEFLEKYCILGQICFFRKDYERAETYFKRAAEIKNMKESANKYKEIMLGLGTSLIMNHKYSDAISVLEKIKDGWKDEVSIKVLLNLMFAYSKKGMNGDAEQILQEADKYYDEIEEFVGFDYIYDIRESIDNLEITRMCPYIYCPRHMSL